MVEKRVQRRLAAILAADVVGYSRLMADHEERTLTALQAHRNELIDPTTIEYGGRIVKLMGDGALVEFPSIVDAVQCAAEIQQKMRERNADVEQALRIEFRMGINLGDVIVDGDDIYGDGVNVAARLEALADAGGICISGNVFDQTRGKLQLTFEDLGTREVKNIPEPIRVYRLQTEPLADSDTTEPNHGPSKSSRPSIVVLPFACMSESREHAFLAEGIVEDLTTHLARLPGFFVIARNSGFAYKGQSPDVRTVGHELGVRYVVQGSLRARGDQLRVTAHLINAETGNHLWAEQYDRPAETVVTVQDELVAGIVGCLEPALAHGEVEMIGRRQPRDLAAWDYYWKATSLFAQRGWQPDAFAQTEALLRAAIAIDPDFALARARLALLLALGHIAGLVADSADVHAEAEHALTLEPNRSEVLGFAGCALQDVGMTARGLDLLERAVELNPSNSQAWAALGSGYLAAKRYEEAIEKLEYALRISPRDPLLAIWGSLLAIALSRVGRVDDAIERARAVRRYAGGSPYPLVTLAALLHHAGQRDDATVALQEALTLHPGLSHREVQSMVGKRLANALLSLWPEASGRAEAEP